MEMINKPHRAERTIDVLLRAFFEEELIHGEPCACAVGNMIQAACNYKRTSGFEWDRILPFWTATISDTEVVSDIGRAQILTTGYSPSEVQIIEAAFENRGHTARPFMRYSDPDSFKGLCAVFDVLPKLDPDYFETNTRPIRIHDNELVLAEL